MQAPRPPRGLAAAGRKLWREVVAEATAEGLVLTAVERYWLETAAKLVDQAATLEAELVGAPKMVRGSQGQEVINPLISELRQLRQAADRSLARLRIEPDESSNANIRVISTSSTQARRAAHTRWRGAGA
ncbi:hypothetical protein BMW24_004485 [Mycobacterium heckeshornense]|uniref:Uncharacterized protein n=2 Tax=Mycobacterium heckeshornense TaxID=110505 RepID=A0A2G8BGS7_9MYCO|nr:hypothetical protein BMW24_004485 [Mycobacterium heckeshornense]BCO35265.1 hypothetical protein MHEC_16980 [Mycobacterium heckeshornense]